MIGIAGAGMTGLALSHHLERRGVEHVVLEARPRPGGVIHSVHLDGRVLELGPQRMRLTPPLRALVDELGLGAELITAPPGLPLYIYRRGKLRRVPFSVGEFLTTDLFTWRGKARLLLEPFTAPERGGESVGAFLSRKVGREAYEDLIGPLYGGLYASDPGEMEMRYTLSRTLRELGVSRSISVALLKWALRRGEPPAACSFRDGMATLTDALYARHATRIRLGAPLEGVERRADGFALVVGGAPVHVEHVVFTTPADVTARLIRTLAPDIAARLERLTYNRLAMVHLHAEGDREGLGYQVSLAEALSTRGVTWNASLFGRDGVYTAFLGGARAPELVDGPDARLGALAKGEFERVTGWKAGVLNVARVRIPAWDRSWAALDGMVLPEGVHLCTNYTARAGLPGRLADAERLADLLATGASSR